MWSGPRNISTAMMYSFASREDCKVYDEPLYGAYLSRTGSNHPGRDEIISEMNNNPDEVLQEILTTYLEKPIIFLKNMAHHMEGLKFEKIQKFANFFLIREPREVIFSLSQKLSNPGLLDTGFRIQAELLEYLIGKGESPFTVHSSTILKDPKKYLSKICELLEIEFSETMLSWKSGGIPEDGIWAKYWYENVHQSTGFEPYTEKDIVLTGELKKLEIECRPYYDYLKLNSI